MVRPLGQGGQLSGGGFRLLDARSLLDVDRYPFVPAQEVDSGSEEMSGGRCSSVRGGLEEQGGSGLRDGCAGPPERCAFPLGGSRWWVRQGTSLSASSGGSRGSLRGRRAQRSADLSRRSFSLRAREERGSGQEADAPTSAEYQPTSGRLGGGSAAGALAESCGSSWHQRGGARGGLAHSCVAVGWQRAEGSFLALCGHPGGELSGDDQVRLEQCLCGDFSGASGANAEAAVLDRAFV